MKKNTKQGYHDEIGLSRSGRNEKVKGAVG